MRVSRKENFNEKQKSGSCTWLLPDFYITYFIIAILCAGTSTLPFFSATIFLKV